MKAFEAAQDRLLATPRFRKAPGFLTVRNLMEQLQCNDDLPLVHVVGTNGKGSVASMISEMLKAHGLKVGLFTSPHLIDIRERMTVNGHLMTKEQFVEGYDQLTREVTLYTSAGGMAPTFFEQIFLMAMIHFAKCQVDIMVIEAGIGGSSDTTNILENRWLNIITTIGMDHCNVLGSSIEEITTEKAGIARRNIPMVVLKQSRVVNGIIKGICDAHQSDYVEIDPKAVTIMEIGPEGIAFSLDTKYYSYERLYIPSKAKYQLDNSALAIGAMHQLSRHMTIDAEKIAYGLSNFIWHGRMEYVGENHLVDGAHNPQGMTVVAEHINMYEQGKPISVIFCAMSDKDLEGMVDACLTIKGLQSVYLPELPYPRAARAEELTQLFYDRGFKEIHRPGSVENFLKDYKNTVNAGVFTAYVGSLYLTGLLMDIGGYASD